ncbi:MAG: ABC transporter permease [Cytophagales bacterium]|nr:MAG: ABC transporter permease [Cytophagales bacterium]
MNVPFFISKRYFFAQKKNNFINIISWMSFLGVAIGTATLIISLSVFNGLENLIRDIYGSFSPDIKIEILKGKTFDKNIVSYTTLKNKLPKDIIVYTIEDNALVKYLDKQTIVKIKGFSDSYSFELAPLMKIEEGESLLNFSGKESAVVGIGVQKKLGFNIQNNFINIQCWYPKMDKNIVSNPLNAFQTENIAVLGSFALEKQYDETYIFVPLSFASKLMNYGNNITAIEIYLKDKNNISKTQDDLKLLFGNKFSIKNSDEQHEGMLRAIKIEKLFISIIFCFILLVCSLNIFFTLSMLAIEKRKDIKTYVSLGADANFIRNIFLYEGYIIGLIGASSGLIVGFFICYCQSKFGLVTMGSQTSLVNAYPVQLKLSDFLYTGLLMIIITYLISYFPAKKAKSYVLNNF